MLRIRISEDPNNLAGSVSEIITRIRIRPSALKVFNTGIDEEKVLLNVTKTKKKHSVKERITSQKVALDSVDCTENCCNYHFISTYAKLRSRESKTET